MTTTAESLIAPRSRDAILDSILRAAADATGAASGWIVARTNDRLVVTAALSADRSGGADELVGRELDATTSAGFCMATGEPAARQPRPHDPTALGAAGSVGVPATLLTVPCVDDQNGTVGVLELADRAGGGFSIDDIELVTLLAGVAGVAIATADTYDDDDDIARPSELAAELDRLHRLDRRRYRVLARTITALLGAG